MKEKTNDILDKLIKIIQEKKYIIIAYFLFNILKDNYIFEVLDILNDYMLPFYELHVGYLILFLSLLVFIFVFKNKRIYISVSNFLLSFFIIWIYIYYRVFDTNFRFYQIAYNIAYTDIPFVIFVFFIIYRIIFQFNIVKKENKIQDELILKDDPIESEEEDELGFNSLVNLFYDNLIGIECSNNSFSAGIVASWGKGKSSFLNLLANKAKKEDGIVVRFNPRASKKVDNIQEEFFNTFSNELSKYYLNIGYNINNYIRSLKILDNNILNVFIDIFSNLNSNTEKYKINEAIDKIGKRIFIIIEDLDRLTKDEILEVFKIIDVNADFKNTIFVSAYDKNYINNIIENEIGKDYTDKYFSYEYTLPEITKNKLVEIGEKYLEKVLKNFNTIHKKFVLSIWKGDLNDIIYLNKNLQSLYYRPYYIADYLDSLRDLKRYINLFLHSYKNNFKNVEPKDFLLCIIIKFKDPTLYNRLSIGYHILEEYQNEVKNNKKEKNINLLEFSNWKYSKEVMDILFHESYTQISYKNFEYYFDAIYKYSSLDFENLLNPEDTDNFLDKAEEIYKSSEQDRLIEFLRVKANIGLKNGSLKTFIYLIFHIKDYDLCKRIFSNDFIKYKNLYNKEEYKNELKNNIFPYLTEKDPYTFNIVINNIIKNKIEDLFTYSELKESLFYNQIQYYENIDNNKIEFDSIKISIVSKITKENSTEIEEKAIENLFNFIIKYADEFAMGLLFYNVLYNGHIADIGLYNSGVYVPNYEYIPINYINLNMYKYIHNCIIKNNYDKFKNWIDKIENKKLKYIIEKLIEYDNNINDIYIHNTYYNDKYSNKNGDNKIDYEDIDFIYNKLKEMENSSN